MKTTPQPYQFVAEPITSVPGQLLGVSVQTVLLNDGVHIQHPELMIRTWSTDEKRNYLYEQLSTITKQAAWVLKRGVTVSLPVCDEESAVLLSHDNALRYALSSLPFVRLELSESISTVRDELRGIRNAMWLSDLGKGDSDVSGLVTHNYDVVKLDNDFFNNEVLKPTFPILIIKLREYCDRIIVPSIQDRRHVPLLREAVIWGVQGQYRTVPFTKVHTLM